MNRLSHQYLLWEEAQDEFRKYQEMYRTAEGVARSIYSCNCARIVRKIKLKVIDYDSE